MSDYQIEGTPFTNSQVESMTDAIVQGHAKATERIKGEIVNDAQSLAQFKVKDPEQLKALFDFASDYVAISAA